MTYLKLKANTTVASLKPYQPGKPIAELKRELGLENIIKLASNENPYGPSDKVQQAITNHIRKLNFYPDGAAYDLKQELAKFRGCMPEQIVLGNGSDEIFTMILTTFCSKDEAVMVSEYAFAAYAIAAKSLGLELQVVPTYKMQQNLTAMLDNINSKTKVVFLANPNNPTASWHKKAELKAWLKKISEYVVVVIDQAYLEYMQDEEDYVDAAALLREHPNLIVTYTFSKVYGLAGIRVGYAICNKDVADLINRVRLPFNVNSLAQVGAVAALEDQAHVRRSVNLNKVGIICYKKELNAIGVEFLPIAGNFVTIKVKSALEVYMYMLQRGIIVRPLAAYKMPDYLRISIGDKEQNFKCIQVLKEALSVCSSGD